MRFYRDELGCARAEADGHHAVLASFLESDIQEDINACLELLTELERNSGTRTGNAFHIEFDDEHVRMERLLDDDARPMIFTRKELLDVLDAWRSFISKD